MRLLVFTPNSASTPTISETIARWNLNPSPPFGPVESQMPKTSAVGHSSSNGVAFRNVAWLSFLPSSVLRNSVPLSSLSRKIASAILCGASRLVTRPIGSYSPSSFDPGSTIAISLKSTSTTGIWMRPSSTAS